jgi:aspartate aminotransferase
MLAERIARIAYSPTLAVSDLAARLRAEGRDILDFSAGQPDFPTPEAVKEAGRRAIAEDRTRYTPTAGIPELRAAIAEWFGRERALTYDPRAIVVSPGAKASLYFAFLSLCDPGDEVIVPRPYWTSYPEQIKLTGAEPVFVDCPQDEGFRLSPERLERACTARTKLLVLNDPANPTGAGYTRGELAGLAQVCLRRRLWIVSDEIYSNLTYGARHESIAALDPEIRARTIVIDGMSKTYSMTGWRIGYAAGPQPVIDAMITLQSQATSNATSISQWASVAALTLGDEVLEPRRRAFEERRDAMVSGLVELGGLSCLLPRGAFYAFPDVSGRFQRERGVHSGQEMSRWLLERAGVAVVPGEAFGSSRHVRLSFACSLAQVRSGLERIGQALGELAT